MGFAACLLALAGLAGGVTPGDAYAQADVCQTKPGRSDLAVTRTIELLPGQAAGAGSLKLADKEIILTFDDGPNPATTPRILDLLAENCIKATFFLLGNEAASHRGLVKRELAEGHAVGGHSMNHVDLTGLTYDKAVREIVAGFAPLHEAGAPAALFRFPNLVETGELTTWLQQKRISNVGVDIDPQDWAGDAPEVTLARLKTELDAKGRGIVLLHDSQANTAKLMPDLLEMLRRDGYRIVHLRAAQADASAG